MSLESLTQLLEGEYGERGQQAAQRLERWLSGALPFTFPEMLEQHLVAERLELVFDAFWQVLPFGTGGRRGRVGYGANRFNPTTLAMTVQGHCHYLKRKYPDATGLAVAVANDVRVFRDVAGTYDFLPKSHPLVGVSSRSLARLACEIYAGNGIAAYLAEPDSDTAVLTTPELSFVIGRNDDIVGGVNLSASHNPPDDNGIKVYDEFGSQPIAPHDQHLVEAMDLATDVQSIPFADGLAQGLIRDLPKGTHEEYIRGYVEMFGDRKPSASVPITYTPLCGAGMSTVGDVLTRLGFAVVVPPDQHADGSFAPIPFRAPNPEVWQATGPACEFAAKNGSSVVLSTDPDADRVGVEARLANGDWYHFDGNQIAAILGYFLMLDPEGPRQKGLVIETIVTTKLLGKVVEAAGGSAIIDDLLVGFKYVADVLKRLGRGESYAGVNLRPEQLVLAAEESHGVIVDSKILDKDAVPACMYLGWLHQHLNLQGKTLHDYYISILEHLGGFDCVNRSIMMVGAKGMMQKDRIMASLRESPPTQIAGETVTRVVDYWDETVWGPFLSDTDRTPRNVMQFFCPSLVVTVRPSGTEPKLKLYCQLLPKDAEGPSAPIHPGDGQALLTLIRGQADTAALQVYAELLRRIDLELSEVALLLPDVVDLDLKLRFERTVSELEKKLRAGALTNLDATLDWLRQQAASMTPGTDPAPALKAPIAALCRQWTAAGTPVPLTTELAKWAAR